MRTQSWMVFRFVIVSEPVLRCFKFSLRCVDIGDGVGFERAQDLSPADKSVDDFVDPAKGDVVAGLFLDDELPHQGDIPRIDGPGFEGFVYGVCCIFFSIA